MKFYKHNLKKLISIILFIPLCIHAQDLGVGVEDDNRGEHEVRLTGCDVEQSITFAAIPNLVCGASDYTIFAVSDAGLPVTLTIPEAYRDYIGFVNSEGDIVYTSTNTAVIRVLESSTGGVAVSITASSPSALVGDDEVCEAPTITRNFIVNRGVNSINWNQLTMNAINDLVYGSPDFIVEANPEYEIGNVNYSILNGDAVRFVNGGNLDTETTGLVGTARIVGATDNPVIVRARSPENNCYRYEDAFIGITVNKAELILNIEDKTKVYGQEDPIFTYNVQGWLNGDNVSTVINVDLSREVGEDVGLYEISGTQIGTLQNYNLTINSGELDITCRNLLITALDRTKVYGDSEPAYGFATSGLQFGETLNNIGINITYVRDPGEVVSEYVVTPIVNGNSNNYCITVGTGLLTIVRRDVLVTVDSHTKEYGDVDPDLTYSVNNMAFDEVLDITISRDPGETVTAPGPNYEITANIQNPSSNYNINIVNGILTIVERQLNLIVEDSTKLYGATDPEFVLNIDGLIDADHFAYNSTNFERDVGEDIGQYEVRLINIPTWMSGNYNVNIEYGELNIIPRQITITADNKIKASGDPDPVLTYRLTEGELPTFEVLASLNINIQREPGEEPGNYRITTSDNNPNYIIRHNSGVLTIYPAGDLIVLLPDRYYGDDNFWLVAESDSGLEVDVTIVGGPVTLTGIKDGLRHETSINRWDPNIGEHSIGLVEVLATQGGDQNHFEAQSVTGFFYIHPTDLTKRVEDIYIDYKYTLSEEDINYIYEGFVYDEDKNYSDISGDTIVMIDSGNGLVGIEESANLAPGSYELVILRNNLTSVNYDIELVNGVLHISETNEPHVTTPDSVKWSGSDGPVDIWVLKNLVDPDGVAIHHKLTPSEGHVRDDYIILESSFVAYQLDVNGGEVLLDGNITAQLFTVAPDLRSIIFSPIGAGYGGYKLEYDVRDRRAVDYHTVGSVLMVYDFINEVVPVVDPMTGGAYERFDYTPDSVVELAPGITYDYDRLRNSTIQNIFPGGEVVSGMDAYYIVRTTACYLIPGTSGLAESIFSHQYSVGEVTTDVSNCEEQPNYGYESCLEGYSYYYTKIPATIHVNNVESVNNYLSIIQREVVVTPSQTLRCILVPCRN